MTSSFPVATHVRLAGWTAAALLLLAPLIAMQFSDEVAWTAGDFAFAALLVLSVGVPLELLARSRRPATYRLAAALALAVWFLTLWLTGAVGIIGSEAHPANLLYYGALGLGAVGALAARLRPRGLARVTGALALALVAFAAAALVAGWGAEAPAWPWPMLALNGFFAALLATATTLFRRAAEAGAASQTQRER
ncbi:MAG: hypothetical protein ACK41D_04285 [Rubricoccaceae bacterium]